MTEAGIVDATYWAGFWSRIESWAFLGVVLTLAIEFIALKLAEPHKEKLEQHRESRLVELRNESERLSKEAETARRETAEAQLQLQQMRSPRSLNIDKFTAAIGKIPPTEVEVLFDANAPDAAFLAQLIWGILFNAKWTMAQSSGPKSLGPPPPNILPWANLPWPQAAGGGPWGLSVVTNDPPDLDANSLGRALVNALMESVNGPPVQTTLGPAHGDLPKGRIRIIVGPKLP